MDPAEERRVPHLDGDEQHLVEREEDGDLDQDRQAAGDRIDLLLLVELHHRLLLLHLVVGEALADGRHLGLHRLHLRHRGVRLVGEREEEDLDQQREDQDGDAEIADVAIDPVERQEHRLGEEAEIAPVDQQLETVEVERLLVAVDDADFLRAREQAGVGAPCCPRRNGLRLEVVAGIECLDVIPERKREFRLHLGRSVGEEGRCPVFVGNAKPGIGHIVAVGFLLLDLGVGPLLEALVAHHPQQAFVQHIVSERLRRSLAQDARIGIKGDRRAALVRDLIADG